MPECPKVLLTNVEDLSITFKKEGVKLAFTWAKPDIDLLRLINFKASGEPLDVVISSPNAKYDLRIEKLDLQTGQIKDTDG